MSHLHKLLSSLFILFIIISVVNAYITYDDVRGKPYKVDYDERAIRINGERLLLISAGVHYPRASPSMWPQIMADARAGGVNVMQTYFFHNYHETVKGVWDWETESRNLGKFLQAAADAGLFVNLRLGSYVCAEWNYGGIPLWMQNTAPFRDYNPTWTMYMERALTIAVQYVEPYLARNGGPIILTQVENEFGDGNGDPDRENYLAFCGNLTEALATDTVWVMCQTSQPPPNIIYACNGDDCSGYVNHQQSVVKMPAMWTENWVGWFERWGQEPPTRSASNVAYTVAHFIAAGGVYMNYYMYFGGTNFGLTVGGPNIITSYDYNAPLDAFGVAREPKYSHSKNLFNIFFAYHDAIIDNPFASPMNLSKSGNQTSYTYGNIGTKGSIAFLVNIDSTDATVTFQNKQYKLSATSVQILDGASLAVIYDTNVYANIPKPIPPPPLPNVTATAIAYIYEPVSIWTDKPVVNSSPMEQLNLTHYSTIYLMYATTIKVSSAQAGQPTINFMLSNANDYEHVFVDSTHLGFFPGADKDQNFTLNFTNVSAGEHELMILSITQGVYNGAVYNLACGLNGDVALGGVSIVNQQWTHQVGLFGEYKKWFTYKGANSASWTWGLEINVPMIWYLLNITTPMPVGDAARATWAFDMGGCGKGQLYANEFFLGAYWSVRATDNPQIFSQRYYHMPRDYLAPPGMNNVVVVFEELGCDPRTITLLQRNATITTMNSVASL